MSKKHKIVNFIIQKLKTKDTSLKKYTNWAKLIVNFIIQKLKSKHTSLKKFTNCAKVINPAYTYKFQLKTTIDGVEGLDLWDKQHTLY